jgi:hypothetical protein
MVYASLEISVLVAVGLLFGSHVALRRFALFILGVFMVWGGVASWTGLAVWKVPFPNKEFFQVSMAFPDLLSVVFMFILSLGNGSGKSNSTV